MTTHRLTGEDLEALLARVPAEHGPDAVITEANRLRRGGVAGFFAKESFEVVVEDGRPEVTPTSDGGQRTDRRQAPLRPTGPEPAPAGGSTLDDLVSAATGADTFERRAPRPGPTLSTEGQPFADVLGRLVREVQDEPLSAPAPTAGARQGEGHDGRSSGAGGDSIGHQDEPGPFEPWPVRAIAPSVTSPVDPAVDPAVATGAAAPTAAAPPMPVPRLEPTAPTGPTPVPATADALRPVPVVSPVWLAELGMPAPVIGALTATGDPAIELLRLMERIPRPDALPTAPGAVIAVIGHRDEARAVAARLAADLRLDPDDVVLAARSFRGKGIAADLRITSAEDAGDQRRSWRRRRTPTVVAVDAPVGRDAVRAAWACHLVDALEPSMVWGVVDATRKPEDVHRWTELVGGVDALAVHDLAGTTSPASVLAAGIPVGLLDGESATAARWTSLLLDRLEVAA